MNLLIEQRPTTITSKLHITNHNDMNNSSSSSSPLVLKLKRHRTKHQNDLNSNLSFMANEDNNKNSRSSTNNQRLKRPIPTSTATRRPSSPAFNGKQQATKRSVTIDNNNNDLTPNIDEISATKRFKRDDLNQSSSTKVDASVETVSIGLATEPDHLGPCEPGTSVVLEGIVWNETDSGVLVVNVTWRGKTYVGTLLDSTKQDWACPRLTCESPTSDYDPRNNSKTSRAKRTSTGNHNRCSNHQSISSSFQHLTSTVLLSGLDDRKLRNNIKSRQSKRTNLTTTDEIITPLTSPFPINTTFFSTETINSSSNTDSQLIPCSESQCHKRFTSTIALDYHLSNAHKKSEEIQSSIQQPSTRDEEDVAHILANVADYVRRASPPASIRCSPEHQRQTTLTWPCPQISSELILSSPLNNNEQTSILLSTNTTRCTLNNNETNTNDNSLKTNIDQDEIKSSLSTVKPVDHFLLHIQDEPLPSSQQTLSPPSWSNLKKDRINNKKSLKIPTPPPPSSSTFVPINFTASIPPPPTASSPAYSDISDEDPTTNENEQQISPSTINLLTGTNGKMNDEQTLISNAPWTTQMLLQQYGSYIQQQSFIGTNNKELTSNRLNSKNNHSSSNGTSDSTVKNILDTRRLSTTKPPSPSSSSITTNETNLLVNDYQNNLYHFHTNGLTNDSKLSPTIMNSLTSPNENLLNPSSSTMNPLDYSLNNTCSTSLHPSR